MYAKRFTLRTLTAWGLVCALGCTGLKGNEAGPATSEQQDAAITGRQLDAGSGGADGAAAAAGGVVAGKGGAGTSGTSGTGGASGSAAMDAGCSDCSLPSCDTAGCDPNATCTLVDGAPVCSCNPGFEDTSGGAGTTCTDKCAVAGCDPNAACSLVDGEAQCACTAPYVGDGATCTFDDQCALLGCHADAACLIGDGTERECRCHAGFAGSGTECSNVDECAVTPAPCDANATCTDTPGSFSCACNRGFEGTGLQCIDRDDCALNPCRNGGGCVDGVDSYSCSCADGYSGSECQTDACLPNPCRNGGTCERRPAGAFSCDCADGYSGTRCDTDACSALDCPTGIPCVRSAQGARCVPSCGNSCAPGAACAEDVNCGANGVCDPTAQRCLLRSCTAQAAAIDSRVALDPFRFCKEIVGDLKIFPGTGSNFGAIELPFLERVTGAVAVSGDSTVSTIRFAALTSTGGPLEVIVNGTEVVQGAEFPALTQIGGRVFVQGGLRSLNLHSLRTVGGNFVFNQVALRSLDISSITSITGAVSIGIVPKLPWRAVSVLDNPAIVAGSRAFGLIGCCLGDADEYACEDFGLPCSNF